MYRGLHDHWILSWTEELNLIVFVVIFPRGIWQIWDERGLFCLFVGDYYQCYCACYGWLQSAITLVWSHG